jgi:hypothetical protein
MAMSLRSKVAIELSLLALLTTAFLLLFPKRNPWIDLGLASVALLGIAASGRYTRNVVWAGSPPPSTPPRLKKCIKLTAWITLPAILVFVVVGGVLAYRQGGWPAVVERVFNWRLLAVFAVYAGWALIQQTLFQFYLLGRLLALGPKNWPLLAVGLTGISISLVHWPDVYTMVATAAAGMVWSFIYFRYRFLVPLAVSHAALGCTFYACFLGQDFVAEWQQLLAFVRG